MAIVSVFIGKEDSRFLNTAQSIIINQLLISSLVDFFQIAGQCPVYDRLIAG